MSRRRLLYERLRHEGDGDLRAALHERRDDHAVILAPEVAEHRDDHVPAEVDAVERGVALVRQAHREPVRSVAVARHERDRVRELGEIRLPARELVPAQACRGRRCESECDGERRQ